MTGQTTEGLEVTLKRDLSEYILDFCLFPSFIVHSPFEFRDGFDDLSYYRFDFGKTLDILVTPEVVSTDASLISIAPKQRNCYFDGERDLKFFKIYSKLNCEMECYASHLQDSFNCTPFYLIRSDSVEICDISRRLYYAWRKNSTKLQECDCYESCSFVKYDIAVIENRLAGNDSRDKRYDYSVEGVTLSFKFKDSEFLRKRRYQPISVVEFLAQSGGLLGLFFGASVLSLVEMFYFFSMRVFVNIFKKHD